MENNDAKALTYLLLQHIYLKKMGLENKSEEEILKEMDKYFPNNWSLTDLNKKIEYITQAINRKQNLRDFVDEEMLMIKF